MNILNRNAVALVFATSLLGTSGALASENVADTANEGGLPETTIAQIDDIIANCTTDKITPAEASTQVYELILPHYVEANPDLAFLAEVAARLDAEQEVSISCGAIETAEDTTEFKSELAL